MAGNRKHIWIILLCVYIAAVAVLCFMKTDGLPEVQKEFLGIPMDKLAHFLMFFPFPIVAYESFRPRSDRKSIHLLVLLVLCAAGLGLAVGTEQIQSQLGYRSGDVNDFYADLAGICCSTFLTGIYIIIKKN